MDQPQKARAYLSESILFLIFRGIIVGLIAGFVVSSFRLLIQVLYEKLLHLYELAHEHSIYLILILGLYLLISLFVGKLLLSEPQIKGSGIPQIEA